MQKARLKTATSPKGMSDFDNMVMHGGVDLASGH